MKLLFPLLALIQSIDCTVTTINIVSSPTTYTVTANGKDLRCPCGDYPVHLWLEQGKIYARCNACCECEICYLSANPIHPRYANHDVACEGSCRSEHVIPKKDNDGTKNYS